MTQTPPAPVHLRLTEAARLLRLPLRTVIAAALLGQLPLTRQGLRPLVDREALYRDFAEASR